MLVTEDKAKETWCPYALVRNYSTAVNRGRVGYVSDDNEKATEDFTKCKASGCMAWRWHDLEDRTVDMDNPVGSQPILPWDRRGYCGRIGAQA
jgi:hypothetical protein